MPYLTISTYNRPWHFALTMLSLALAERPEGLHVRVIDDGTNDGSLGFKRRLLDDLAGRGIVQEIDWREPDTTLPGHARYNAIFGAAIDGFLTSNSSRWVHLDDDLCFSPNLLARAVADFDRWLGRGVVYLFINAWGDVARRLCNGPLWHVKELGGCAFIASRSALTAIGNIFATRDGQLRRHEDLWGAFRGARETLACNRDEPYPIQHTANAESLLFGHQENWRDGWQRDLRTGQLVDVPPFGVEDVARCVNTGTLEQLVRAANTTSGAGLVLGEETSRPDGPAV